MPELPEMENYKLLLSEKVVGKSVSEVIVTREKTINVPVTQFTTEVQGRTIMAIERRAKHLLFKLDSGKSLLLHLMLGGLMYVADEEGEIDRTKQVTLSLGAMKLFFIGLRLGYLHLVTEEQVQEAFSDLGPEPLEPTFKENLFQELIAKRRGMLKTTLVNQKFLAGIGNLYSDEICFEAQVLQIRKANELTDEEIKQLFKAIHTILQRGIRLGGYMDVPVHKKDQLTGNYSNHCYVYEREGLPCPRCGGVIIKDVISSRKSFYCKQCQK
ncbi:bifunctional DNA-formamidopyrimidine glycosylase/DNA-(apurinic or apyrimidinic site) lyase [Halalkalibacter kiskunsagensis]|uniref:Formamidopyrimidine-DNA glycosylase n=1 Tax=Halalkalibacter kiskunsagensis TaxID=1548599 RepID=A0ABV6KCR6_9BACI